MKKMSDDTKKKVAIIGGLLLIVLIIVLSYFIRQNRNYKSIKLDKNNYLVYTQKSKSKGMYSIDIPYLNMKGESAKLVNEDITAFLSDYIDNEKCIISYQYDISGVILSLVVKVVDYDEVFAPKAHFKSYNINLDTLELIDDVSLLSLFGTDEATVESILDEDFHSYYNDILEEEYYNEKECNYECFLKYREIDNYLDEITYYVKEGNLMAYRPFVFYSVFGEEKFFTEDSFNFLLVKTES